MNETSAFIAAIRGPIMMIALGLLFAMDRMGGYGFGQTWPVLIIVFGVLILLERSSGRKRSYPDSYVS
ncbi:MAG: hypothetical protein KIT09_05620 [Bryobacteraceae bacterium]|nr:hypothetical protein [Bryobacteraceae bacterium]